MKSALPPQVEVRRSARRRRTVSAYRDKDVVVVLIPARFSRAEESRWVDRMVADVLAHEQRALAQGPKLSDASLLHRARELNLQYFDGSAVPSTVRWVTTMGHRWGSCTPVARSIRLSDRLKTFPDWVVDYVLVHELAHLLVSGHDQSFWTLVNRYERTERARGYLEGHSVAEARAGEARPDDGRPDEARPDDRRPERDRTYAPESDGPAAESPDDGESVGGDSFDGDGEPDALF